MKKTVRKLVEEIATETKTKPQATQTITTLRGLLQILRKSDKERVKQRKSCCSRHKGTPYNVESTQKLVV